MCTFLWTCLRKTGDLTILPGPGRTLAYHIRLRQFRSRCGLDESPGADLACPVSPVATISGKLAYNLQNTLKISIEFCLSSKFSHSRQIGATACEFCGLAGLNAWRVSASFYGSKVDGCSLRSPFRPAFGDKGEVTDRI
jgi:hypothetical protein